MSSAPSRRVGRRRLKTLGEAGPPVVNVNGPRYGAIWGADRRLLGLNNIELITDRDLEINLREIKQVKKNWPTGDDRFVMVNAKKKPWKKSSSASRKNRC